MSETSRFNIPKDWDEWISRQGFEAGFCQTSTWAILNAAVNGATSCVVSLDEAGERRAGALLSCRTSGKLAERMPRPVAASLSRLAVANLECFEGPVLQGNDPEALLDDLLVEVDALSSDLGVPGVRFAAPPAACEWLENPRVAEIYARHGYVERSWQTTLIDLTQDEDRLLAGVDRAVRKAIRKCEKANLAVYRCESFDSYFTKFRIPYLANKSSQDEVEKLKCRDNKGWDIPGTASIYSYYWVEDPRGTVLATLGTYSFNKIATEIMSGRTPANMQNKIPAQDFLHWKILLRHKGKGDKWFNLAGFNPSPTTPKEQGIRRFKEKWGGKIVNVPEYHKDRRKFLGRLVKVLKTMQSSSRK